RLPRPWGPKSLPNRGPSTSLPVPEIRRDLVAGLMSGGRRRWRVAGGGLVGGLLGWAGAFARGGDRQSPPLSVARLWDEQLLAAIRIDIPKPPAHARNLFHLSIAMWDAWAVYDPAALGYLVREKHAAADVRAARREAISYASYRLLKYRFPGGFFTPSGVACPPNA